MMLEFERDPNFKMEDVHELSRAQLRERAMNRAKMVAHYLSNESVSLFKTRMSFLGLIDAGFMTRMAVHVFEIFVID